ncbi:RNase P modulator RnpM [Paraliobacillus ryukyuensis]|uniref:RNase P modulator RnpM n=1 Tax=Paraliobacillus ryukyuensis TaxID=200904 RepID=UPI0009A6524C|nr:YlxR family protein [Paraliobacillus ryukyuensis]
MPKKNKKIPLRKCVITQEMKPKQSLIRIVRTKEGEVFVDPSGKKNGRGTYISKDLTVLQQAKKSNALDRQLQTKIDDSIYEQLEQVIEGKNIE